MAPSQMAATTAVEAFGKAMPSSRTTAPTMVHFSFVRSDIFTGGGGTSQCGTPHNPPLLRRDTRPPRVPEAS